MCGGKVKKLADKVGSSIKEGAAQLDPTTETGLANLATGGLYGSLNHTASMASKIGEESERTDETEAEKAAAEVAAKEYDFARQLDFVKDEYRTRVDRLGSKEMQSSVMGRANIGAQSQVKAAADNTQLGLSTTGIDPSSGRATSTMNKVQSSGANAIGLSQAESAFALDSAHLEGQNNSIAMALGEKTKAVAGLSDIAHGANNLAIQEANRDFNNKAATNSAIGTAVGMGTNAYINRDK